MENARLGFSKTSKIVKRPNLEQIVSNEQASAISIVFSNGTPGQNNLVSVSFEKTEKRACLLKAESLGSTTLVSEKKKKARELRRQRS